MSIYSALTLFTIMLALAALPSASVALVVARSGMLGIGNGIATALGIIAGDLIFVCMVLLGLTTLSAQMGAVFVVIRYLAAGYLIWFGFTLLKNRCKSNALESIAAQGGIVTSFISGLLLTLGDVKAIFFYASLFPAFIDLSALHASDIALIVGITIITVGGVKILYALGARKIIQRSKALRFEKQAKTIAGGIMIGTGGYLIAKS